MSNTTTEKKIDVMYWVHTVITLVLMFGIGYLYRPFVGLDDYRLCLAEFNGRMCARSFRLSDYFASLSRRLWCCQQHRTLRILIHFCRLYGQNRLKPYHRQLVYQPQNLHRPSVCLSFNDFHCRLCFRRDDQLVYRYLTFIQHFL